MAKECNHTDAELDWRLFLRNTNVQQPGTLPHANVQQVIKLANFMFFSTLDILVLNFLSVKHNLVIFDTKRIMPLIQYYYFVYTRIKRNFSLCRLTNTIGK